MLKIQYWLYEHWIINKDWLSMGILMDDFESNLFEYSKSKFQTLNYQYFKVCLQDKVLNWSQQNLNFLKDSSHLRLNNLMNSNKLMVDHHFYDLWDEQSLDFQMLQGHFLLCVQGLNQDFLQHCLFGFMWLILLMIWESKLYSKWNRDHRCRQDLRRWLSYYHFAFSSYHLPFTTLISVHLEAFLLHSLDLLVQLI